MKKFLFICLLILLEMLQWNVSAFANIFSMDNASNVNQNDAKKTETIPVFFNADKHIQKRQQEAYSLVLEGNKLIKKGKKKNNKSLITKGQIKKEIGEKQLKLLKEQAEERKRQDNELQ